MLARRTAPPGPAAAHAPGEGGELLTPLTHPHPPPRMLRPAPSRLLRRARNGGGERSLRAEETLFTWAPLSPCRLNLPCLAGGKALQKAVCAGPARGPPQARGRGSTTGKRAPIAPPWLAFGWWHLFQLRTSKEMRPGVASHS